MIRIKLIFVFLALLAAASLCLYHRKSAIDTKKKPIMWGRSAQTIEKHP